MQKTKKTLLKNYTDEELEKEKMQLLKLLKEKEQEKKNGT